MNRIANFKTFLLLASLFVFFKIVNLAEICAHMYVFQVYTRPYEKYLALDEYKAINIREFFEQEDE